MIGFVLSAAGLVAATLALLLRPWWGGVRPGVAPRGLRRRVYLQQRDELARDRAAGLVDEASAAEADLELQRRLLEDLPAGEDDVAAGADARPAPPHAHAHARREATPWVLAFSLPVLAAAAWWGQGPSRGLDTGAVAGVAVAGGAASGPGSSAPSDAEGGPATLATVEARVERLAARLREHPDDPAGWARLARSWRVLGRASDAQQAFEHVGASLQDDPTLLAEYADTLAAQHGGRSDPQVQRVLHRALALDPRNPMALSLAATLAWNARDYAEAGRRWRELLAVLPPDSHDAMTVRAFLDRLPAAGSAPGASGARPVRSAPPRPSLPPGG